METLTRPKQDLNVLILKSNISTPGDIRKVDHAFSQLHCIKRWTVDLDDWEHILKVESYVFSCENIAVILKKVGFECSELDH